MHHGIGKDHGDRISASMISTKERLLPYSNRSGKMRLGLFTSASDLISLKTVFAAFNLFPIVDHSLQQQNNQLGHDDRMLVS